MRTDSRGVSPSWSGGNQAVFARVVSTDLGIKFYLASARSAVSQDSVWEPRVLLIPCRHTVSVIHTAVENHSSSCSAALLMLTGLEHWSSWLSGKREVWLCCSFFLFRNSFLNICLESTKTSKRLIYNFRLSYTEFVTVRLCSANSTWDSTLSLKP